MDCIQENQSPQWRCDIAWPNLSERSWNKTCVLLGWLCVRAGTVISVALPGSETFSNEAQQKGIHVIVRYDRLAIELPQPDNPDPNAAAAVQELMGGKFGEMSTLMNYTFQSFNFRDREAARPYYDLIANIAAEEYSHIELVAYTINMLLTGATARGTDPTTTPLQSGKDARNSHHFIASGQTALPVDSMGRPWTGDNVFSSGNLKLDLIHNFFLECGARANKIRAYETTNEPTAGL